MPSPDTDLSTDEKLELLKELKTALYSGVRRIRFRERDVTYHSTADLKSAVSALEAELGLSKGKKTVGLTTFHRGY